MTRDDLLEALLGHMAILGEETARRFPDDPSAPLEQALREALDRLIFAWRIGVGSLWVAGLLWGQGHERLRPAYVRAMLEPVLQRTEAQLTYRLAGAGLDSDTARHAALALVSPVLVALLHQESLHGATFRPLDVPAFLHQHLQRFLRGWFDAG